jgi:hypothetical protein
MSVSTSSISSKSTLSINADEKHPNGPPEEIEVSSVHSSSARFVWPKIKCTNIQVNGETIPGYRFIQDDNKVDRIFVDVVLEVEPFAAKHGEKEGLWTDVEQECKDRGAGLFHGFKGRNGRDRLKAYQKFVSKFRTADKKNTGCDNQQPPTKLLKKIESLVDKLKGFTDEREVAKKNNNTKKKDKEVAKSVRMAALGCHLKESTKKTSHSASNSSLEKSKSSSEKISKPTDVVDEDVVGIEDGALILYDSTDDESYQDAKRKAESLEIDAPPSKNGLDNQKIDDQKNKKRRTSFGDERNTKRESLENSLKDHNVLLADSTKKKYNIEQRRLALEEDRAKKEDRRIAMEEARVEEQKEERAMNREFMMSVISMMKVMSDNLTKLNDSKK